MPRRVYIAAQLGALFLACAVPALALPEGSILTPDETAHCSERALGGDITASERMAYAAQFTGTIAEGEYWTIVAAENGSILGIRDAGVVLMTNSSVRKCGRALYWFKRFKKVRSKLPKRYWGNTDSWIDDARQCYRNSNAEAKTPLTPRERRALAGDQAAALALSSLAQASNAIDEAAYWLQIAAQNGSLDAARQLGRWLPRTGTPQNCRRAIYWLRRLRGPRSQRRELTAEISALQTRCPPIPVQSLDP